MEIKKINSIGIVLVFALVIFTFMLIMTNKTPYKKEAIPPKYQDQVDELNKSLYDAEKTYSLDNNPNIVHWEIIDGELSIYTKADSIRDERERWRYKDSLYKAETKELFDN
tara:strand:- start:3092 stop:3424 length:333 start_codon:yes stop_codon:yes gene_type:complete